MEIPLHSSHFGLAAAHPEPPLNAFKIRTHNYVHNFLKRAASVFLPTRRQGAAQFRWPWLIFIRSFQHAKAVAA